MDDTDPSQEVPIYLIAFGIFIVILLVIVVNVVLKMVFK
jgi:hypothetical protein